MSDNISIDVPIDILIRNGWVIDGTGNTRFKADIAVREDRIVEVGNLPDASAKIEIDANGKIVCPGLIDCHSHSDSTIKANPEAQSSIRQGITTEIVGNCGNSAAPVTRFSLESRAGGFGSIEKEHREFTFASHLDSIESMGTSINLAWLVGHNSIRAAAGVRGPAVSEDQFAAMEALIREAMDAGAIGLSTGLEFEPGRSCSSEEIVRLAGILKDYDGIYTSHIRNRDAKVLEALDEFLNVARTHQIRAEVSHMNIRHNTGAPERAWEKCVEKIKAARAEGIDVLADMTPLNFGMGQMAGILPPWVRAEGTESAVEMLRDPETRQRLRTDCDRYWRFIHRGEWDRVRMQSNPAFPEINGLDFFQISDLWKKDPWDCYFDILAAAGKSMDAIVLVARLFTDEHLRETIAHPLYMLGVDGFSTRTDGPLAAATAFPLHYMGMTYFLAHHVRERKTLTLEEAIRKMTSMPAGHFRLRDRGVLRPSAFADITVFDFENLDTVSTIENPHAYVRGVEHVIVNGVPTIAANEHTGARRGRTLRPSG